MATQQAEDDYRLRIVEMVLMNSTRSINDEENGKIRFASCNEQHPDCNESESPTHAKTKQPITPIGIPVLPTNSQEDCLMLPPGSQHGTFPGAFAVDGPGAEVPMVAAVAPAASSTDNLDVNEQEGLMNHATEAMPFSQKCTGMKLLLVLSLEVNVAFFTIIIVLVAFIAAVKEGNHSSDNQQSTVQIPVANTWETTPQTQTPMQMALIHRLNLPEYTQRALANPRSPQAKAYDWLDANVQNSSNYRNNLQMLPNWRLRQRFALATFYYSTRGDYWVNKHGWLDWNVDECNWEQKLTMFPDLSSRPICNAQGQLQTLSFGIANNMDGTIPPEISLLNRSLQALSFSQNFQLKGRIPTELGLLTNLTFLQFMNTRMSGRLPTEIGQLKLLECLVLGNIPISGSIPSELGLSGKLESLVLIRTHQTGSIPTEICRLLNLKSFSVMECPELSTASFLPHVLGNMQQLESFALSRGTSEATMSIPSNLGMLSGLTSLGLKGWKFTGRIPSEIGQLSDLMNLDLRENSITGSFPAAFASLSNLQHLDVGFNRLHGTLPPFLYSCVKSLKLLSIKGNQFSGSISTEVGLLSSLRRLELQNNTGLTGTLPTELLLLENLTSVLVANTSLSGSIPAELCDKMVQKDIQAAGGKFYQVVNTRAPICQGTTLCGCECGPCH